MCIGRTARSLEYFQHNLADVQDDQILTKSPLPSLPKYFSNHGYATRGAGKVFHREANLEEFQESKSSKSVPCPCSVKNGNCPKMICSVEDSEKSELTDSAVIDWGIRQLEELAQANEKFFMTLGLRKPHLPYRVPESSLQRIDDIYGSEMENMPVPTPKRRTDAYAVANYYCDAADEYLSSTQKRIVNAELRDASGETYYPTFLSENDYDTNNSTAVFRRSASSTEQSPISTQLGSAPVDDALIKQLKRGYFAAVHWADELFGVVEAKLTELGLDENTVVVMLSDNGFNLGEQGNYCKNNNFENSAQVPLIIRHPRGQQGVIREEIVSLVDLYPTIVKLARPLEDSSGLYDQLHGTSFDELVVQSVEDQTGTPSTPSELEFMAFSGITRCWDSEEERLNNCERSTDINVMGYSVRTLNFRYTEWRMSEKQTTRYQFLDTNLVFQELYSHADNPSPDRMETVNLASFLDTSRKSVVDETEPVPDEIEAFGQDYLRQLMKVLSNTLEAQYSCDSLNCVPITETFSPTASPTPQPSDGPTGRPTTQPLSSNLSNSPTPGLDSMPGTPVPSTSTEGPDVILYQPGYNTALSAGISIVIMLACVAIAVTIIVYTKKVRADKLRAHRIQRKTRWKSTSKPV